MNNCNSFLGLILYATFIVLNSQQQEKRIKTGPKYHFTNSQITFIYEVIAVCFNVVTNTLCNMNSMATTATPTATAATTSIRVRIQGFDLFTTSSPLC